MCVNKENCLLSFNSLKTKAYQGPDREGLARYCDIIHSILAPADPHTAQVANKCAVIHKSVHFFPQEYKISEYSVDSCSILFLEKKSK